MPRKRTVSNEHLLDAARSLFLRDGFSASTVEIARHAGISEATVFKRFPTKIRLFQAAMGIPECVALQGVQARVGEGELHENLRDISRGLLAFYMELVPRLAVMAGAPTRGSVNDSIKGPNSPPQVVREELARYLEAEFARGRLGAVNPYLVAQILLGTLHSYAFFAHVGIEAGGEEAAETFVDEFISLLWRGIAPEGDEEALP